MEELINKIEGVKEFLLELAKLTRDQAVRSYRFYKASEEVEKAITELKKRIPQDIEIEGGGSTWWYVCPECHGAIDRADHFCKHCGQEVKE